MEDFRYKAFVSYSHRDRAWAKWLHRKLESFIFPKYLVGSNTVVGKVPLDLKPIFRDREELAAGHSLGEKIETALLESENLIVICSPSAAQSHWVNQEIIYFKRHNRGAKIFSVIVDGEPFAQESQAECFPESLRFECDSEGALTSIPAEPLAADFRPNGDGKRLGVLKLISGIVGLGVDDLVQRDLQRARKRVIAVTASAAAIVVAMGGLTWTAIDARNEAEQRRNDAEGQIEFMLTDLKDELEGVGRLDALQVVGEKAASYYDQYPISDHDDDALGRRARVYHYLGEVQDNLGNLDEAEGYFKESFESTEKLLARSPSDPERIFEHAQSVYWRAFIPWRLYKFEIVEPYYLKYLALAEKLAQLEGRSVRSLTELSYATTNLGTLYYKTAEYGLAKKYFTDAHQAKIELANALPTHIRQDLSIVNAEAWLADTAIHLRDFDDASERSKATIKIIENIERRDPKSREVQSWKLKTLQRLAWIELLTGSTQDAESFLLLADSIAQELAQQDKSNSDWAYAILQSKLMLVEYRLQTGQVEKVKNDWLFLKLISERFSESSVSETERFQRLKFRQNLLEIHFLVLSNDTERALERVEELEPYKSTDPSVLVRRDKLIQENIPLYLLKFLLLNDSKYLQMALDIHNHYDLSINPEYTYNILGALSGEQRYNEVSNLLKSHSRGVLEDGLFKKTAAQIN